MKSFIFSLFILLTLSYSISAQNLNSDYSSPKSTIRLSEYKDQWKVSVQPMEMIHPGGNSYQNFLFEEKNKVSLLYPRKKTSSFKKSNSNKPTFIIENSFEGNLYNNKVPNDNTLAISNDGIIIAGINSSYIIYDLNNDSLLLSSTLNSITSSYTNLLFVKKYDPKFIYDHEEDRFVLVFLVGNKPANSHVCVAFSTSNDPMDDWNVYMPSGDAFRPGDIVKLFNGKTAEILNTDAEGRLILADGLAYGIKHFQPSSVMDFATLTGACIVALGTNVAGIVSNNTKLASKVKSSSAKTSEEVWELPINDDYMDMVKSKVADIRNLGMGRAAGTITAAAFLANAVGNVPWVHFDIAGTAWIQPSTKSRSYNSHGATGFGVRLVVDYLMNQK